MMLSDHFDQREFEMDGPIPAECIPVFQALAQKVLEPVRWFVGRPISITSGYRSPEANKAAHGVPNSEHVATPEYCAADFTFDTRYGTILSIRAAFDWIRSNPSIPFHQVILEHGAAGSSIIHISYNDSKIDERSALEGATHNASPYTKWDCVAFVVPEQSSQENA